MKIIVQSLEYARVYVTETSTYKSLDFKEKVVGENGVYTAEWPNEVFITLVSVAPTEQRAFIPEGATIEGPESIQYEEIVRSADFTIVY